MVSESSPLLVSQQENGTPTSDQEFRTHPSQPDLVTSLRKTFALAVRHVKKYKVLYYIAAFSFIIDISFMMMIAPMARLTELGLCRRHFSIADPSVIDHNGDIPELLCKIKPVQESLAKLNGVLTMLAMLPTLFFSIPFGILADKFGRKTISVLGVIGLSLGFLWYFLVFEFYDFFPLEAVYAFPLFFIIGGGGNVIAALISAMVADVTPRDIRARVYILLHITIVGAGLIGPPIGAVLLKYLGPRQAFLWSLPPRLLSLVFLYLIPETKDISTQSASDMRTSVEDLSTADGPKLLKTKVVDGVRHFVEHVKHDIWPIISRLPVLLGMISLVVNTFAVPVSGMLVQYVSVKFLWKFSQAAYVIAFTAGVQILLLSTAIPYFDHYLKKKHDSPEMANLALSRASIFFLVVGMLVVGLAPDVTGVFIGLFLFTCGSGYMPALRSFMTSLVSREDTALLFTMIGVFDSIGALFGAPLLALSFSAGIDKGGLLLGLPFYCAAAIYALSGVSIWSLTPPTVNHREDTDNEDSDSETTAVNV